MQGEGLRFWGNIKMSSVPRWCACFFLAWPWQEMEKFKALAEYNNLAFVDLEQRLSAVRKWEMF